jgi:hypothetical protein
MGSRHDAALGHQLGIGGELERLDPPRLDAVLAPDPDHGVVADAQPGWWGERDLEDLAAAEAADRLRPAWSGQVRQADTPTRSAMSTLAVPRRPAAGSEPAGPELGHVVSGDGKRDGGGHCGMLHTTMPSNSFSDGH